MIVKHVVVAYTIVVYYPTEANMSKQQYRDTCTVENLFAVFVQ